MECINNKYIHGGLDNVRVYNNIINSDLGNIMINTWIVYECL